MNKGRIMRVLLGCAVAAALLMAGTAGLADAAAVKISPFDFSSDGYTSSGDYFKQFSTGRLFGTDAAVGPCLAAPVTLPGSATKILGMTVYLTDDGSSGKGDPWFRLTGMNMKTGITTDYVFSTVTTGLPALQGISLPVLKKKVTKGERMYIGMCLYAGQALYGVKVNYQ